MTSHFLTAIFGQVASKPIVPKAAAWKAAALATELAIAMLADPAYAALTTGGDTVQGLCDALLGTAKRTFRTSGTCYTSILRHHDNGPLIGWLVLGHVV